MTIVLRVLRIVRATPSARLVQLALDGRRVRYRPGQAFWLGRVGQGALKPYSVANAAHDAVARGALEFLVGTRRRRSLGRHLRSLRPGTRVIAEGPVGSLGVPRRLSAPHLLLVAGGTGVAPLRAILQHALHTGYRGRITLVYSARTPRHFAFVREWRRLARDGRLRLYLTATGTVPRGWRGGRGRLTSATLRALVEGGRTLAFVCGPEAFVRDVARALREAGLPPRTIRTDARHMPVAWKPAST